MLEKSLVTVTLSETSRTGHFRNGKKTIEFVTVTDTWSVVYSNDKKTHVIVKFSILSALSEWHRFFIRRLADPAKVVFPLRI